MHKRHSIISSPMLIGIVLSIALHGAAFYGREFSIYTPPQPKVEHGQTVVHFTLVPSIASRAAAPEPTIDKPIEQLLEVPVPIPVEPIPTVSAPSEALSIDAVEQDASLEEDKGVTAEAALVGAFRPPYPRVSKRRGETGTVMLSVHVLADGTVDEVAMLQSSGYRRLDEAALNAARKTTFTPAMRLGQSIDSKTELSFNFMLTDD